MPVVTGYKGTITFTVGGSAHVLNFIGQWSAESKRDVKKGKPRITATSTGTSSKTQGSKELSGSCSGQVIAAADVDRAAVITAHLAGTLADIVLTGTETGALGVNCPGAIISGLKLDTDSESGMTLEFSFESGDADYTFPETA